MLCKERIPLLNTHIYTHTTTTSMRNLEACSLIILQSVLYYILLPGSLSSNLLLFPFCLKNLRQITVAEHKSTLLTRDLGLPALGSQAPHTSSSSSKRIRSLPALVFAVGFLASLGMLPPCNFLKTIVPWPTPLFLMFKQMLSSHC